jgi:hypothetical protein
MNEPSGRTADEAGPVPVTAGPRGEQAAPEAVPGKPDEPQLAVVRRSGQGWRVDDEELPDLMSAIVLADLLTPELPGAPPPAAGASPAPAADGSHSPSAAGSPRAEGTKAGDVAAEAARLRVTVAQLQHALATRVRVEQAIGVIAERRRVAPRQAFELLRTAARADGTRLAELAARVVDSVVNPLLPLPEELARPPRAPRARGRSPRHMRAGE